MATLDTQVRLLVIDVEKAERGAASWQWSRLPQILGTLPVEAADTRAVLVTQAGSDAPVDGCGLTIVSATNGKVPSFWAQRLGGGNYRLVSGSPLTGSLRVVRSGFLPAVVALADEGTLRVMLPKARTGTALIHGLDVKDLAGLSVELRSGQQARESQRPSMSSKVEGGWSFQFEHIPQNPMLLTIVLNGQPLDEEWLSFAERNGKLSAFLELNPGLLKK
jgi:hypothetical protein